MSHPPIAPSSTGAQLRSAQDELDRLRDFVQWCASLDQPQEGVERLELWQVAEAARQVLA